MGSVRWELRLGVISDMGIETWWDQMGIETRCD